MDRNEFSLACKNFGNVNYDDKYCPFCQVPFSLVQWSGKGMHLEVCFRSKKPIKECPKGLRCKSEMAVHYRLYQHPQLAYQRSSKVTLYSHPSVVSSSSDEEVRHFENSKNLESCTINMLSSTNNASVTNEVLTKTNQAHKSPTTLKIPFVSSNDFHKPTVSKVGCSKVLDFRKSDNEIDSACFETPSVKVELPLASRKPDFKDECIKLTINGDLDVSLESIGKSSRKLNIEHSTGTLSDFKKKEEQKTHSTCIKKEPVCLSEPPFDGSQIKNPISLKSNFKDGSLDAYFGVKSPVSVKNSSQDRTLDSFLGIKRKGIKTLKSKESVSQKKLKVLNDSSSSYKKTCPFYKKVEGTSIAVDAFNYGEVPGVSHYFLSHFHYDHFIGLSKHWKSNIYCSKITAELVRMRYKTLSSKVMSLPMNEAIQVDDINVTLFEANHCPGAAIFVFKLANSTSVLHTGDFRADNCLIDCLTSMRCHFSVVYLDTTYLNPKYAFPSQDEVVRFATSKVTECLKMFPNTLVISGTYTIGKEKIFLDIAQKLQCKICVTKEKLKIMNCFQDKAINSVLTTDPTETNLHVVQMKQLQWPSLKKMHSKYSHTYTKLLAIKPTGWTFDKFPNGCLNSKKINFDKPIVLLELPYSEHSSFLELQRFVEALKPRKIIPTVNVGNASTRTMMNSYLDSWKR